MNPPGRSILVIAIVALLGMMGGIVYYASLDNDDLSMATIELQSVELTDVNSVESRATLQVIFLVEHEINDGRKISSGNQQTISSLSK